MLKVTRIMTLPMVGGTIILVTDSIVDDSKPADGARMSMADAWREWEKRSVGEEAERRERKRANSRWGRVESRLLRALR